MKPYDHSEKALIMLKYSKIKDLELQRNLPHYQQRDWDSTAEKS